MASKLEIKNLHVVIDYKEILKGLDLTVNEGETHAIMGPNGSGKSTLANVIMGHPKYKITSGDIIFEGKSILALTPDRRAKLGLFMAFQHPLEISGVSLANFLRTAYKHINTGMDEKNIASVSEFRKLMKEKMNSLGIDEDFAKRYLNEGLSGGEKKKSEVLQATILRPKIAILDETDSGTDVDAMKTISDSINNLKKESNTGILMITHYNRILKNVKPDLVHIMVDGRIVKTGDASLADRVESSGYNEFAVVA
ncbi:MAG: Fe-S cluster assembly ATPase SufC [Candidatus Aenigmarchaeota archaeon]|nr:Fe-S cluster assembly ATPase SufC [Candidatus Aenigmarchaeota archaeon]